MYKSLIIANYFIHKSMELGVELTPMKLLKLVYISHGWFMGYNKDPLISDAVFAWRYGPVIKEIYDSIKRYGKGQITSFIDINGDGVIEKNERMPGNPQIQKFLDIIWDRYLSFNGLELSTLTHQEGSPWDQTIKLSGENSRIPNEVIRDYYKSKINRTQNA